MNIKNSQKSTALKRSEENFQKDISYFLGRLDQSKIVDLIPWGNEGPMVKFRQGEEDLFSLEIYMGVKDYRSHFIDIAEKMLGELGFKTKRLD